MKLKHNQHMGPLAGSRVTGGRAGFATVTVTLVLSAACSGSIDDDPAMATPKTNAAMPPAAEAPVPTPPPVTGLEPGSPCANSGVGVTPLRRLTRLEYNNTVRALFGDDISPADTFTADEQAGAFPANFFSPISELQFGEYASAAATLAERAVASRQALSPCDAALDEVGCATSFIQGFGRRAYRRPLEPTELTRLVALFEIGREGAGFDNGIRLVAQAMLESPHFLYLVEGPGPLTPYQLASRLSYFLWKGPPDAVLDGLADTGELAVGQPIVSEQVGRMLADERAQGMLKDFHDHWLALEEFAKVERDPETYPDFPSLRDSIREETSQFVNYVVTEGDGRLETLLTAPFSVVNGPLAKLYGANQEIAEGSWQRVELDPAQRSGILTQAAFLTAHGQEGSAAVHRGVTLREQIFCTDLPPPPPNAGIVPTPTATTTTRQRLEQHSVNPTCAACHTLIDGLGFGLEAYDGIGAYRETENGQPIDNSGEVRGTDVDGPFQGARELAAKIVESERAQGCFVQHWFRYALGRIDTEADQCAIGLLQQRFAESGMSVPDLIVAMVENPAFQAYRAEGP